MRGMRTGLFGLLLAIGCGGDDDGDRAGIDAGRSDSGAAPFDGAPGDDAAAPDAGAFVCGEETCDEIDEYCYQVQAGARAAGNGPGCNRLPAQCDPPATCECVLDRVQTGCPVDVTCDDTGGRVVVTCALP